MIELVVVIAIIGILAAAAMPNFMKLSYRSRRAEAFQALHAMSIAESAFFTEAGVYATTFEQIGFELSGGTTVAPDTIVGPHYTYTLAGLEINGIPNGNYRITATGDIDPSDAVLDIIIIENQLTIVDD